MFFIRRSCNISQSQSKKSTLREKCPTTEFFLGPYFPAFGLNTEISSVNLSEYRKIWTRKNSVFWHFSRSVSLVLETLFYEIPQILTLDFLINLRLIYFYKRIYLINKKEANKKKQQQKTNKQTNKQKIISNLVWVIL